MPPRSTDFTQGKPRSPSADFADHCCELLGSLGPVTAKRMFLGWGLSVEGLTVAVIAWETLYLKTNDATQAPFVAAGCRMFEHESKGRVRHMHYHTAPEEALESRTAMQPWAALALKAALAAVKPASPVKKKAANVGAAKARKSKTPGTESSNDAD